MKKLFTLVLSLLMGIFALTGCSSVEGNSVDSNAAEPTVSELLSKIEAATSIPNVTTIDDADTICTMYDLDTAMIAEMAMLKSGNGANADEVIVVKTNDSAQLEPVQAAFELRLSVLADTFADYTPEDMPKIENAITAKQGCYLLLAVCENPDAAADAFEKAF